MQELRKEVLDELLTCVNSPDDVLGPDGLLTQLKKAVMERLLEGEMVHHLGYEKHAAAGYGTDNSRNGHTSKRVLTDNGVIELKVPRDRKGTFEPQLIKKRQRRLPGFDDKIISLYARGMTVREIQGHLEELYGTDVSPALISAVTDGVLDEVNTWQNRQLAPIWPIFYLDALVLKVRENGRVQNKSAYLALGVNLKGQKEVLGIWLAPTEGAKFWLHVITELKNRGVQDVFIACCDGLKGFPEAIAAVFPQTLVQTCMVHMIRNSLRLVSWGNRKAVAKDLRAIYSAATEPEAQEALRSFQSVWDVQYPSISQSWRSNWDQISPFFAFPKDIRRAIYTTNAIESLNHQLRKVLKTRGSFSTDEAAIKLLWLALDCASAKWTMPIPRWDLALQQFAIHFEGRLDLNKLEEF